MIGEELEETFEYVGDNMDHEFSEKDEKELSKEHQNVEEILLYKLHLCKYF
jgi:hypothetical protein